MKAHQSPCKDLADTGMAVTIEKLAGEASHAFATTLNDWLGRCVELWCPRAFEACKAGACDEAHRLLVKDGFYWKHERFGCDEVVTFYQHDVAVMRCRLEFRLLNPEWVKLGPKADWHFVWHRDALEGLNPG